MTNRNVPKLRFPEFTDEWNSLSLNDVSNDCSYGVSASATEFDREYKYIRITDIDDDTHKFTPSPLVSPKGDIDSKYILHEGDLVFARTGATVGKSYLYEPSDGTLVYAGYLIRFHIDRAVPKFIFYLTNRSYYWNWVSIMSVRSGQPGINMEEYKKLPIIIPSNHEQEKITSFLSKIDKKIDLLRDKKDEYIEFKRYLLQNLFPQNGETAPKLRFTEYHDEWKIIKLGNIVNIRSGESPKNLLSNNGTIPYFKVDHLNSTSKYLQDTEYYIHPMEKIVPQGSIIFPKRGMSILQNKIRILKQDSYMDTNLMTLTIKPTYNNEFIYYYLTKENLSKIADATSIPQLNNKHINPYKIKLPKIEEQCKIASFLSFVDKKIDLLYQEIEYVEEYKKGLLQKMFI